MKNGNQYVCICLYFMMIQVLLGGCSTVEVSESSSFVEQERENIQVNIPSEDLFNIHSFKKVLLISPSGKEVNLDPIKFKNFWSTYFSSVTKTSVQSFEQRHTLIIWDEQNQPSVVHVSDNFIKVGQDFYTHSNQDLLTTWIEEELGEHFFQNLHVHRMSLSAKDISSLSRNVQEKHVEDIMRLLVKAALVSGERRIDAPLFPAYELYLETSDGSSPMIRVLSPTLIQVQDDQYTWFYQLDDSLFKTLTLEIPIPKYSYSPITKLFQANDLLLRIGEEEIAWDPNQVDTIQKIAKIHQVVRLLSEGTEITEAIEMLDKQDAAKKEVILEFMEEKKAHAIPVEIVDQDYFIINEKLFLLRNIRKRLQDILGEDF